MITAALRLTRCLVEQGLCCEGHGMSILQRFSATIAEAPTLNTTQSVRSVTAAIPP
jgi:hypothetical protein